MSANTAMSTAELQRLQVDPMASAGVEIVKQGTAGATQQTKADQRSMVGTEVAPGARGKRDAEKKAGPLGPARGFSCQVADYAVCASCPQILFCRVSGIRNRLSTKHTAGTAIG